MTRFPEIFAALNAPFERAEVKSRVQAGRTLEYITARTAMNRLDSILGPENWEDDYTPGPNSVICRLTIRIADPNAGTGGGWIAITKADAGGYAGMADEGDDDKSGFSDAFKRAAVKFGVGRYLYRDGVPTFARPDSPAQAGPAEVEAPRLHEPADPARRQPDAPTAKGAPRSGRALFAWVKEQEQRHEIVLLKYLNNWAKLQEFPGRMVDWDGDQVALGHAEASRKLEAQGLSA